MAKQWGHGFHKGRSEGIDEGAQLALYQMAQKMRVLFCVLVTAHKRGDSCAFWAAVEIIKHELGEHAFFNAEDWALCRGDTPRKDSAGEGVS